ncbi:hypothetical protein LJR251_001638 [Rhizobium rhizogenes]|uniref:hypothetical protein n=1 Tax=Rhizobium rhizogenes TaxID=359 RepID=UPI003ED0A0E4
MRERLENIIELLIELMNRLDGDPDIEFDPAEDGIADLEAILEQYGNHGMTSVVI